MASLVPARASIHARPSWIISPHTATSPTTIAVKNSIHNRPKTNLRGFQTLPGSKPSRPSVRRSRAHSEVIDTMPQVRDGEAFNSVMQPQSEKADIYANISTIPISASLIGSGVDASELTGRVCNIADGSHKKQLSYCRDLKAVFVRSVCNIADGPHKKQDGGIQIPPVYEKVCLFYCDETEELARRIAAETDSIELSTIKWGTFADGFPNVFVPNAHGIRGQHVAFLASFSSPSVIFEQLSIIYALPRMFVSSFTLVLPFFPTGTLERMEDEGDIATAFTLARILSNIPISRGGPTSLVIFDIHALQERFYFGDNVLPCFESGIPLLKHRLHQLPDSNNVSIAFPDEGAWKRFYKQLQHFPMIICTKVRDGDTRIVKLKEGDPKGRHVVIVDDLVQSGGTLIECQKLLATMGAAKVSAYVTHGVFPNKSWERFKHDNGEGAGNGFSNFWITDSCAPTVKQVMGKPPFEVLSLAGSIAVALHI